MAGITEYKTAKSISSRTVWGKSSLGTGYAVKWKVTTDKYTLKSPCRNRADAEAKMSELAEYSNVYDISGVLVNGGMWEVTATLANETWVNQGTYHNGVSFSV